MKTCAAVSIALASLALSACPDQHPAGALPVEGEQVRWGQDDKKAPPPSGQTGMAPQGAQVPPTPGWAGGKPEQGREVFVAKCQACHGDKGQGGKTAEGKPVPALVVAALQKKSDRDLARHIAHGQGDMPGFMGQLNRQQLMDLIALLRAGFGPGAVAPVEAATSRPAP